MRDFRLLIAGQALSWLGTGFQTVALPVAILLTGGSAADLGYASAASVGALLLCTLFGGVWGDRVQPRVVLVASDLVRLVCAGGLATMFGTGHDWLPVLCGLAAISSGAGAFFQPAMFSLRPALVPVQHRQRANATLSLFMTSSQVAGPIAGGLVIATTGPAWGFAINGFSYLASVGSVLLIRTRASRAPREPMLRSLGDGWREIRRHDWLLVGVLAATLYHLANGVVRVLTQVEAVDRLGGARALGFLAAAQGLGALAGSALALRLRARRFMLAGQLALVLMPLWAFSYVWPAMLPAVLIATVVGYAGLSYFSVAWETAIQDQVPHDRLGRVSSWDSLTSFVAMPVGNLLAGPLAGGLGSSPVLAVSAAVLVVASLTPLLARGTRTLTRTAPEPVPAVATLASQ